MEAEQARAVAKAVEESGEHLDDTRPTRGTLPGDWAKLRGIPAIGRGVRGAIKDTRPGDKL
jgi:hypothetical protein